MPQTRLCNNAKFLLGPAQSFTNSIDSFWDGWPLVHGQNSGAKRTSIADDIFKSSLLGHIVSSNVKASWLEERPRDVVKGLQMVQEILTVGRCRDMCLSSSSLAEERSILAHGANWRIVGSDKEPSK